MTDIQAMKAGRELDALMAERVMGWYVVNGEFIELDETARPPNYISGTVKYFCPSTDISAAVNDVEAEIERRGLRKEYGLCLLRMVAVNDLWWHLAHATPEQRCKAALMAAEEVK